MVHLGSDAALYHCIILVLNLLLSSCFVERLIVVAEHYESNLSDFQKQGKAVR